MAAASISVIPVACGSKDEENDALEHRDEAADAGRPMPAHDAGTSVEPLAPMAPLDVGENHARCPTGRFAGAMVFTRDGYCVDRTETTQASFQAFVDDASRSVSVEQHQDVPEICSDYVPTAPSPNLGDAFDDCPTFASFDSLNTPDAPVVCIDWCDAFFYCRAAGKRLCGAVGGTPVDLDEDEITSAENEWIAACRGGTRSAYPYGATFDEAQCAAPEVQPVATQDCDGATTGVHDLVGNVAEWTHECDASGCLVRGGAATDVGAPDAADALACLGSTKRSADTRDLYVGIRCCADGVD